MGLCANDCESVCDYANSHKNGGSTTLQERLRPARRAILEEWRRVDRPGQISGGIGEHSGSESNENDWT